MTLALKNGVGGVSAGTCVELIDEHGLVDISKQHDVVVYTLGDPKLYIDTTTDNLVELRSRVDEIPANYRYARRAEKREAWATLSSQDN